MTTLALASEVKRYLKTGTNTEKTTESEVGEERNGRKLEGQKQRERIFGKLQLALADRRREEER